MEEGKIRSRQNALVKHARCVRDRKEQEQIFVEGMRLAEEALRSRLNIQDALYTEKLLTEERGARLLYELKAAGCRLSSVSDDVLDYVSDTRRPQGVILLASRPRTNMPLANSKTDAREIAGEEQTSQNSVSLVIVLHGINNPSNAGAILRTAEAAGATQIISTRGTTDIFSPKALRGAMGASFRLPIWTGIDFADAIDWCRQKGLCTIGASLRAEKTHTEADWTNECALVLGPEAAGLTGSEQSMLDETIRIPMRPPVESLNVAVACGIILYEADRQRKAFRKAK